MPYDCEKCDKKFRYKISLRTHKCTGYGENNVNKQQQQQQPQQSSPHVHIATDAIIDDTTANDPDLHCSQSLDEFITESCNRMGLADTSEIVLKEPPPPSSSPSSIAQTAHTVNCDAINLNDLPTFCTFELPNTTDLTNVIPSMSEIFPQTMDIMNALYANETDDDAIQHLYADAQPSQHTHE